MPKFAKPWCSKNVTLDGKQIPLGQQRKQAFEPKDATNWPHSTLMLALWARGVASCAQASRCLMP